MARAHGLGRAVLEGPRFRRIFRGVYLAADVELTFDRHLAAAMLALPPDAVVSHSSAMQLYGVAPSRSGPLELSTNRGATTELEGVVLHRRQGRLHPVQIQGMPVTGPDRTFVDLQNPSSIPWRVYAALAQGGYAGPPPRTSAMWHRWFSF